MLLLTSARLSTLIERYVLARLAGPHITRIGQYAAAASPLTAGGIMTRAMLRRLPHALAERLLRRSHQADTGIGRFYLRG